MRFEKMLHCKNCGAKNPPSKGRKKRIYCSQKCANRSHHLKTYTKKNPDWGTRGLKEKQELQARKEEYERLCKTHLQAKDIAKMAGWSSPSTAHVKARELGIKPIKQTYGSERSFWTKEQAKRIIEEKVKKDEEVPEEFATIDEVFEILGFTTESNNRNSKALRLSDWAKKTNTEVATKQIRHDGQYFKYYKKDDIRKLRENIEKHKLNIIIEREKKKIQKEKARLEKELEIVKLAKKLRETTIDEVEFSYKLNESLNNDKLPGTLTWIQKNRELLGFTKPFAYTVITGESPWRLNNNDISAALKIAAKNFLEIHKGRINPKPKNKTPIRSDNWQDWENRENRLINSLSEKAEKEYNKYLERLPNDAKGANSRLKVAFRSYGLNLQYHYKQFEMSQTQMFSCKNCKKTFPYYEFRFDETTKKGRRSKCRYCEYRSRDAKKTKERWINNHKGRIRTLIGMTVKQKISQAIGYYAAEITAKKVWKAIEEKCGYGPEELCKHLESKFGPNMNWQNQTTPRKPGEFGWHLDHIIPQSQLPYDSLEHPNFAKVWDLSNLQPLQARMNLEKSNKKLITEHRHSFLQGLKKKSLYKRGIWKHLPYTNLEAKEKLEKTHNTKQHIDHIDPLAHLPYNSVNHPNFLKAWDLSNLRVISMKENTSKGSIWENEFWIHNWED